MTFTDFMNRWSAQKSLEDRARNLDSGDPAVAGASRRSLMNDLNALSGSQTIIESTSDNDLKNYAFHHQNLMQGRSLDAFRDPNPAQVIGDAKAADPGKFKDRFLEVTPYIGVDAAYDSVVPEHLKYRELSKRTELFEKSEDRTADRAAFVQGTADLIRYDVEQNALQGLSATERAAVGGSATAVANAVSMTYRHMPAEQALWLSGIAQGNIANRVEAAVPEADRADYAERMLKAGALNAAGSGDRAAWLNVAEDLYRVAR